MDKINLFFSHFYKISLFLSICASISCSSIKIVTVKNDTADTIQFRGQFSYEYHKPYNLDFILPPGGVDSWRYETGYMEEKYLDNGLKKIILKNSKGCEAVLDREMIDKISIKDGMWKININEYIMGCI